MRAAISQPSISVALAVLALSGCGGPPAADGGVERESRRSLTLKFDERLADSEVLLPTDFDGRGPLPSLQTGPCFPVLLVANPVIRPGVCGDAGDDTLYGSRGTDDLFGGPGNDRCETAEQGIAAECERSIDNAEQRCDEDVTIEGTSAGEVLIGTEKDDVIDAGAGNDTLDGVGGDDLLCAGPGEDLVIGGAGDDRLLGETGRDQLIGGIGDDLVDGGPDDDGIGLGRVAEAPAAERTGLPFGGSSEATLVVLALVAVAAGLIAGGSRSRRSRRRSRRRIPSGSEAAG